MAVPGIQAAFSAGEISPSLYGHVDYAKFHVAATTLRNCFVNYRGGAYSRAGTALAVRSRQAWGADKPRIIPFQFKITQGYALEFGDYYMRVISDGAPVVEAAIAITAATNTDPCSVSISGAFNNGDWIAISGVDGMTQLNGEIFVVGGAAPGSVSLYDMNGNPINAIGYGTYTSGGSAARIYTLSSPYAARDLPYLKYTQSADVMTLCCVNSETGTEYPPYDLARISATDWTLTATTFSASIQPPASVTVSATVTPPLPGVIPEPNATAYAYKVTAISLSGEESVASYAANITNSVDISSTAGSIIIGWTPVSGAATYNVYKALPSYNTGSGTPYVANPVPAGSLFGFVGRSYGNQFVDTNVTADFSQVPPRHKNPFATGAIVAMQVTASGSGYTFADVIINSASGTGFIGESVVIDGAVVAIIVVSSGGAFSPGDTATISGDGSGATAVPAIGPQSGVYPGVPAYYQQRRVYASSLNNPDTFWMSKPGVFLNFDSSIPSLDTDAITGTPWSQQVNGIQFMLPMPGGLVVLTGLGAWQVTGAGGSAISPVPITPTSEQAQPQAFSGCSAVVPPVQILQDIIYVQAKGAIVRDLAYNYWVNIYTGSDLTELSSQLFTGFTMVERAWCEEPYKVLWYVRSDGSMLSLTYLKEQQVYGWGRHDTLGQVVSVCSVTEPPVDALYLIAARPTPPARGGFAYYIERMDDRIWSTVEDVWAVDCGLEYPMPQPDATLYASSASGSTVFLATSPVFTPQNVGQVIRMGGGIATITAYDNTQRVEALWNLPCSALTPNDPAGSVVPQLRGAWTMTQPVSQVGGLTHLVGLTVTGLADGVPIPPTIVGRDGTIPLPFPASSIKVGLGFVPQLQTPYLDAGGALTLQGRRKSIVAVTARLDASGSIEGGTNQPDGAAQSPIAIAPQWSGMVTIPSGGATYTTPGGGTATALYTGDARQPVPTNWAKPGQVAFQQTEPLPMTITACIPETLEGDAPEQGYPQQERPSERSQMPPMPRGPGLWMLQR